MGRRNMPTDEVALSREERDIARRWCIFNCWGWPPDLQMPAAEADRRAVACREMAKAVRAIGQRKVMAFWNGEWRDLMASVKKEYGF